MSQRAFLAISALSALTGGLLLLWGPPVGVEAAGPGQFAAMDGSTGAIDLFVRQGSEAYRALGALLLGAGLLGCTRSDKGAAAR
ncbi:MAG: hypothetical protein ACOY93_00125 [Bacillota bacterium]